MKKGLKHLPEEELLLHPWNEDMGDTCLTVKSASLPY